MDLTTARARIHAMFTATDDAATDELDRRIADLESAVAQELRDRIAVLEKERLAICKLLPVKTPEGRFADPVDAAYAQGGYYAYASVADVLGAELPYRWAAVEKAATPDVRFRVSTENPSRYLRSSTGILHLRRPGPEDDGLSYHYARCGWYAELGREAIPLTVGEDARLCKKCPVIEPS
ncbi:MULTISPECIES: hypothetical protein [unclassified Streptomyces]|uniref:hypothetical protein n=1 Tax=unclassified Streptomyces TaxID=2593676 RepID=UPI0036ECC550